MKQAPVTALRWERQQRGWSRNYIAEQIGVEVATIGRWERGETIPHPEHLQKVCELFEKNAQQLGFFQDAYNENESEQVKEEDQYSTVFARTWGMHYPHNLLFTGRKEILDKLHRQLGTEHTLASGQSYALFGLGGMGKTQTALEYAYRYAQEYNAIFWIEAETTESILASILYIAEHLQLSKRQETDQQQIVEAVRHWLSTHRQWLMIWDNLEDLELLQRFLPPAYQGALLITTRKSALGTLAHSLELPPMTVEEGTLLLLRRAKILPAETVNEQTCQLAGQQPATYAAARELVTALGGLPLALDQAGAYIEETGCSFSDYLLRYERQRTQLLDRRGESFGSHPRSVTSTFRLSYQRVTKDYPVAADLLRMCAFLYAEAIPEELFVAGAFHLAPAADLLVTDPLVTDPLVTDPLVTDPYQLDLAIAALRTFSLIQRHANTRTLSIHRLVQAVLQEEMSPQERSAFQQRVIRLLNAFFPEVTYAVWGQCKRFLPHVLICVTVPFNHTYGAALAHVLQKAANYLREHFQYEQAEPLYQRALSILEQDTEPEHPLVASTLHGLALLYQGQTRYQEARAFHERALRIREQAFGSEHPLVAYSLNVLGLCYSEQGQYKQAEALYQRALRIREQAFGSEHPLVASPLSNLADLCSYQENYEQAEVLYRQALQIWTRALEPDHPQRWEPLNGLADIARKQGKYEQAEALYQQALHLLVGAVGPDDPDVAFPLSGLAAISCEKGQYEEAEKLYQRALYVRERLLGPHHPKTARSLANLAKFYEKQGICGPREALLQRACTIFEQHLGPDHPETIQTRNDYRCILELRRKTVEC